MDLFYVKGNYIIDGSVDHATDWRGAFVHSIYVKRNYIFDGSVDHAT